MSGLEIARLDPFDPVAFDAWHAAYLAAEQAGEEGVTSPFMLEEARAHLQDTGTRRWNGGWMGPLDGRVVAAGWLDTPLLDNLDRADLSVHVVPGRAPPRPRDRDAAAAGAGGARAGPHAAEGRDVLAVRRRIRGRPVRPDGSSPGASATARAR